MSVIFPSTHAGKIVTLADASNPVMAVVNLNGSLVSDLLLVGIEYGGMRRRVHVDATLDGYLHVLSAAGGVHECKLSFKVPNVDETCGDSRVQSLITLIENSGEAAEDKIVVYLPGITSFDGVVINSVLRLDEEGTLFFSVDCLGAWRAGESAKPTASGADLAQRGDVEYRASRTRNGFAS